RARPGRPRISGAVVRAHDPAAGASPRRSGGRVAGRAESARVERADERSRLARTAGGLVQARLRRTRARLRDLARPCGLSADSGRLRAAVEPRAAGRADRGASRKAYGVNVWRTPAPQRPTRRAFA